VRVRVVERLGSDTIVYGNLADDTAICAAVDGLEKINAGDRIHFRIDPQSVHVFDMAGHAMRRLAAPEL
jgi:ABC-type sugar transport system ATPase subunit